MFITFEGVDNTGKTSVTKQLYKYLKQSNNVYYYNEPLNNQFGEMAKFGVNGLKSIDHVYLWWTSRKFELNLSKFKNADIILADRYYDSTYVYGKLFNHSQDIVNHNFDSDYFKKPDLTFIFQGYGQEIINRNHDLKDNYNDLNVDDINLINQIFNSIPTMFPERKILTIDSMKYSISEIFNLCLMTIQNLIPKKIRRNS